MASLQSDVSSLQREMSDNEYDVVDLRRDLDSLNDDVCGWSCSLRFGSIDSDLNELVDCVNQFIDAWASNGRTFYC